MNNHNAKKSRVTEAVGGFHYPQETATLAYSSSHAPLTAPDWPPGQFLLRSDTAPIGAWMSDDLDAVLKQRGPGGPQGLVVVGWYSQPERPLALRAALREIAVLQRRMTLRQIARVGDLAGQK